MDLHHPFSHIFDTIYIGGGTPSVLTADQLEIILNHIFRLFTIISGAEITIEVNPADLYTDYLKSLQHLGFNRLNIGIQSFDDHILSFLGRRHDKKQAVSSINAAFEAGFDNIGLDLIYGIPGQNLSLWLDTLRQALLFNPSHLSCYQLTIEKDSPLGIRYQEKEFTLLCEDDQYDFFMNTSEFLEDHGYIHYEVSNFSKEMTLASRHNQKYWDHTHYLGLGPSAHSFDGRKRWWNHQSTSKYIEILEKNNLPIESSETLKEEQLKLEALFLGLRTKRGIHLPSFSQQYQDGFLSEKNTMLSRMEETGLIKIKDGYLRPTKTGMALADSLALI
jgi:oxygen-independent coproporphyrinogen-3 oxidase